MHSPTAIATVFLIGVSNRSLGRGSAPRVPWWHPIWGLRTPQPFPAPIAQNQERAERECPPNLSSELSLYNQWSLLRYLVGGYVQTRCGHEFIGSNLSHHDGRRNSVQRPAAEGPLRYYVGVTHGRRGDDASAALRLRLCPGPSGCSDATAALKGGGVEL